MRRIAITIALWIWSCAGAPASRTPASVLVPRQDEPTVGAPTAEDVGPKTCHEFVGNANVEQWREQLIAAVSQRDDARTTEVVRCVDPDFDSPLFEQVGEWLVLANPRQLDEDADEEWVLELRQHTPITGDGERFDLVWLGVLDWSAPRYTFAGSISRAKIRACLMTDDQGLAVEFSSEDPSAEAAMVVTEQHTESCARNVDVSYSRTRHRVIDGKLVAEPLEAPAPKRYTR